MVLHDAHGRPRVVVGGVVAVLDDVGRRSVVVPEVAVPHEQALTSGQLDRAMADKIRLVVVLGAAQVPHVRDIAAVDRQVVGSGVTEMALPNKVADVARGLELLREPGELQRREIIAHAGLPTAEAADVSGWGEGCE